MIDRFFYNFFSAIDNAFEWLEKLFIKNERHKIIRKTSRKTTTK